MNPWTILLKPFFCTIPFIPEINDNSWDSFRKTDQNFKNFSETAQKLTLQNADCHFYFQNLLKNHITACKTSRHLELKKMVLPFQILKLILNMYI